MRTTRLMIAVVGLIGCGKGGFDLGQGGEVDGRLTSDVYTWDCQSTDVEWMGVFGFDVALEFVPDDLDERHLPPVGSCDYGKSMFATDSPVAGTEIPEAAAEPRWTTSADTGLLQEVLAGYWFDEVYKNVLSCNKPDDVISSGVELSDAGWLDGATTPESGSVTLVTVDSEYTSGIPFGSDVGLSWDADGWDESFVQVRRVRDGIAVETLTCNTTGSDTFDVDSDVWGFFNESVGVDLNYVYVGFRNNGTWESPDGLKVDVATRALHVVGIVEL